MFGMELTLLCDIGVKLTSSHFVFRDVIAQTAAAPVDSNDGFCFFVNKH